MAGTRGAEAPITVTDDQEIESLLAAFEDTDCRAIIEATMETALSAKEVAETCDLPLSTAYRKLDELTEVGILDEQIRLSQSGQHKSEYVPKIRVRRYRHRWQWNLARNLLGPARSAGTVRRSGGRLKTPRCCGLRPNLFSP